MEEIPGAVDESIYEFRLENDKIRNALEELQKFIFNHPKVNLELVSERKNYFAPIGRLKENLPSYHQRINVFLSWFVFDHPSPCLGQTPIQYFRDTLKKDAAQTEFGFFDALSRSFPSMYEVCKIRDDSVKLKDLFTQKKVVIPIKSPLLGVFKGDVFETRLFNVEGGFYFSNYLLIHPQKVRRLILQRIKLLVKQNGDREKILGLLYALHIFHCKWESYQQIDIHSIYDFKTL